MQQMQKRSEEAEGRYRRKHQGHEEEAAEAEMMIAVLSCWNYVNEIE